MNSEELSHFLISFSKLFFEVWINVNKSNRIKRLDNIPKIYDKIKLDRRFERQQQAEEAMNLQREQFLDILLNGFNIPVLVYPHDYVVIKLKDERNNQLESESNETIFLAFKVLSKMGKNFLFLTGLTHKYNTARQRYEYRQGCQAKYLAMFLEQNGLPLPPVTVRKKTKITDEIKGDKLRRQFINDQAIKSQDIFKQEEAFNGQNAYFYFYLELINQLKTQEDIDKNHQFYRQKLQQPITLPIPDHKIFINDALPPDSPYYIECPKLEEMCKCQIKEPAAFIRIKGPRKMGKTSLLYRILESAEDEQYLKVFIDGDKAKVQPEIITNFYSLCKWLCSTVSDRLGKEDKTEQYFSQNKKNIIGTTERYFHQEILSPLQGPVVLAIDNVDTIFEKTGIVESFCTMIASWHRESKAPTNYGKLWANLRIVLAHSTDVYIGWEINRSPFKGIGYVPNLLSWNESEISKYAEIYGVKLTKSETKDLKNLVDGHPYLIRLATEYLYNNEGNIQSLLEQASTSTSPFNSYFKHEVFPYLQKYPQYVEAFCQILNNNAIRVNNQVELDEIDFKLNSLGLIRRDNRRFYSKYNFYNENFKEYFEEYFNDEESI